MGEFGQALRRARETAGKEIQDLAETTRIQPRYLEALEAEDWKVVPAGIIGRGFVRVIARELGLPPAELLERYRLARGADDLEPGRVLPDADLKVETGAPRKLAPLVAGIVAALLVVLALGVWYARRHAESGNAAPTVAIQPPAGPEKEAAQPAPAPLASPAPSPSPAASPSPAPSPTASPTPLPTKAAAAAPARSPMPSPEPAAQAPGAKAKLELVGVEQVWVRVILDGKKAQTFTLAAGDRKSFEAEKVEVKLGKAHGAKLLWNGEALKAPGQPEQVVTVVLPRDLDTLR